MMHGLSIRGILLLGALTLTVWMQSPSANAQSQRALSLMPWPSSVQQGSGELRIDASFSVALTGHTEPRLDHSVARFLEQLRRETAAPSFAKTATGGKATLTIQTDHASKDVQELGEDENYTLEVTSDGAKLSAATPLGTMHGLQTFLQLVEPGTTGFDVPVVTIQDQPRFPWRGLMIDVGRHFIPLDVLRRNIDGMEAVKMNVFHLHLSENQGFRIESKKFTT
jgi:hexosaminidase